MKNRWVFWGAVCLFIAVAVFAFRHVQFDWSIFWRQVRHADGRRLLFGVALIYFAYLLRAARWSVFLRPQKRVPAIALLGSQVIGFTAVALFGRLADLVRPYLVAKKASLTVSSQIAVYAVERMFDALAMALAFSLTLAFAPDRSSLPHHEAFIRTGWFGLAAAIVGGTFAVLTRTHGERVARSLGNVLGRFSPSFAESAQHRILSFREGMDVLRTFQDFAAILLLSLAMWGLIILAYVEVVRSFAELSMLTFSRIMLVMAAGMGSSILQLPVVGWFTQIGLVSAAMKGLGAPLEPSIGCGALLLLVTFMSVIPLGLIYSQIEQVSLRKVTRQSEDMEVQVTGS